MAQKTSASVVVWEVRFQEAPKEPSMAAIGREADTSSALHLRFPTAHLRQFLLGCLASRVEIVRQVL